MHVYFRNEEFVRISYNTKKSQRGVHSCDVEEFLQSIFREVFHKFEEHGTDSFGYDFIVMATEDLDTFEAFVRDAVTSRFPGVAMDFNPYEI